MAQFLKPSNLNNVWASGGDRIYPGDTKYATGWQVEIPPRQYFNEIDYKQDQMLAHLNQYGIPVWDNETEYQADTSYTQGATNGTIYRAKVTHTGQNPELDTLNAYWDIAFAAAGDFYTKVEVDDEFLAKDQNLGDLPSVTDARANLSVYSKTETYTKTEIDAKTTVASAEQAQSGKSNTVLVTPLRLQDSFKGVSQQLLAVNGFQKFPGGLVIQWGLTPSIPHNSSITVTFPTPFPNNCFVVSGTTDNPNLLESGADGIVNITAKTNNSFTVASNDNIAGTSNLPGVNWFAIGN